MTPNYSVDDLKNFLNEVSMPDDDEIDPHKLRYVIYARKSTEDKKRQIKSIKDQITECRNYAEDNGYRVTKIFREEMSAKEPDIRPVFY